MKFKDIDAELRKIPWKLRIKTFGSLFKAGSGHVGPCLSMAEILTCLFFRAINKKSDGKFEDYFVLSKGHGVPILYSVFAELGLLHSDELHTLRKVDSRLQGHPDMVALDLLDSGSGALGQGLSISIGYAHSLSLKGSSSSSIAY